MAAGRPTKYSAAIVKKAKEYAEQFEVGGNQPKDEVIPSVEGLSLYIGIRRSTIYEWIDHEDKKVFSDIVAKMLSCQGKILLNGTLSNKLNSNVGKAILTKHGYTEKQEIDHTSNGKTITGFTTVLGKAYGTDEDSGDAT